MTQKYYRENDGAHFLMNMEKFTKTESTVYLKLRLKFMLIIQVIVFIKHNFDANVEEVVESKSNSQMCSVTTIGSMAYFQK